MRPKQKQRASIVWSECRKKRRYETPHEAMRAGNVRTEEAGVELHVYPCNYCDGWHLARGASR
jgi:hypothetical protein